MRVALIILSALLAASCGSAPADPRGLKSNETYLAVSATARAEARPDEARLSLGVQSLGANAAEAGRANREKMARVTAALAGFGVGADDIQTRNVSLQRIDYGPERGRFRADNVVTVRMRDMARVGEAIAAATEAGANLIGGPDLAVSDPEAATRQAYADAYRAARARAEAYAGAAEMKISRVLSINDGGDSGPTVDRNLVGYEQAVPVAPPPAVAMEQAAPSVPFSPGTNRSDVRVSVAFALTPK